MRRLGAREVHHLLESHGLSPSRALGQNFVCDPNTVERIARLSRVGPGDAVIEVGAGLGSLTFALHARGAVVTALELDHGLCEVLVEILPPEVELLEADALSFDFSSHLATRRATRAVVVANLPYNVATPLVVRFLEEVPEVERLLVMVQREVGERLAASPGSKVYGAPSVRVAYFATAQVLGAVPASVFYPRPHVDSVLVEILRRPSPAVSALEASYEEVGTLVRAGFAGRRKMLRRALAGLVEEEAFVAAGVAPTDRAEQLDVVAFGKLARCQRLIASSRPPS